MESEYVLEEVIGGKVLGSTGRMAGVKCAFRIGFDSEALRFKGSFDFEAAEMGLGVGVGVESMVKEIQV